MVDGSGHFRQIWAATFGLLTSLFALSTFLEKTPNFPSPSLQSWWRLQMAARGVISPIFSPLPFILMDTTTYHPRLVGRHAAPLSPGRDYTHVQTTACHNHCPLPPLLLSCPFLDLSFFPCRNPCHNHCFNSYMTLYMP